MKDGYVMKAAAPGGEDMEKINRYTRRSFTPEEVYTFSVVLCDNEVDRDFERFSTAALEALRELFVGKTCIFDHERKSANQTARIYDTSLEREEGRVTESGEPYVRLTARAYLPRTDRSGELITAIDSGILKEVSISCSVRHSKCSICGKEQCQHVKGRAYQGKRCVRILDAPADAYECSFVAVPAQREAGVTKGFSEEQGNGLEKSLQSLRSGEEVSLSAGEARALYSRLEEWKEKAEWGERWRDGMKAGILKYSALIQPELPRSVMVSAVEGLSMEELSAMEKAYGKMARERLPLEPQLRPEKPNEPFAENGEFQI